MDAAWAGGASADSWLLQPWTPTSAITVHMEQSPWIPVCTGLYVHGIMPAQ